MSNDENKTKKTSNTEGIDHDVIRDLAGLLDETDLTEIEVEQAGLRIRVSRQGSVAMHNVGAPAIAAANPAGPADAVAPEPAKNPGAVTSPMVGTVYLAPQPGAPNFIEIGAMVSEGQTLMIVEAMKTMNPIPAPRSGKVTQILVDNEQPIEFGEPLVVLE